MTRRKTPKVFDEFNVVPSHLPSAQEAVHAQGMLAEAMMVTSALESKMRKARSTKQREGLQTLIVPARLKEAKIRAFLAPIRRLPEELLAEIFCTVTQHLQRGCWPLTQVCRAWRMVALNTPTLWSNVRYSPNALSRNVFGKEQCKTVGELARAFRRSKEALLELELDLSFTYRKPFPRYIVEALSSVLDPISGRLRKLTLLCPGRSTEVTDDINLFTKPLISLQQLSFRGYFKLSFFRNLLQLVDDTASNLSQMKLIMTDGPSLLPIQLTLWPRLTCLETKVPLSLPVFSGCINLRTLLFPSDLDPSWLNHLADVVTFPHLEAATINNPHVFFARISAPALRKLLIPTRFVSSTISPPIHLPSLLELEIPAPIETFTDFCVAPLLRSMQIGCKNGMVNGSIISSRKSRTNVDEHTASSLEHLKLENVTIDENILLDILQRHYRIKELVLDEVPCTPAILTRLCALTNSSPSEPAEDREREPLLCPLLEKLTIRLGSHDCPQTVLRRIAEELVAARANSCRPLTQLLFFQYRHGHTKFADDLVAHANDVILVADSDTESRCNGCDNYHVIA